MSEPFKCLDDILRRKEPNLEEGIQKPKLPLWSPNPEVVEQYMVEWAKKPNRAILAECLQVEVIAHRVTDIILRLSLFQQSTNVYVMWNKEDVSKERFPNLDYSLLESIDESGEHYSKNLDRGSHFAARRFAWNSGSKKDQFAFLDEWSEEIRKVHEFDPVYFEWNGDSYPYEYRLHELAISIVAEVRYVNGSVCWVDGMNILNWIGPARFVEFVSTSVEKTKKDWDTLKSATLAKILDYE